MAARKATIDQDDKVVKPKRKASSKATEDVFDPYADVDNDVQQFEKVLGLSSSIMDKGKRLSSGLLTIDLILGGGYIPGMYTNVGFEQSCKTTEAITALASLINFELINNVRIPHKMYFDFEGSGEPNYIENIFKTMKVRGADGNYLTVHDVFGKKNKQGEYITKPMIRYYNEDVAENFFNMVVKVLKSLPNKVCIGDTWYLIYDDTKENRAFLGDRFDRNYWRETKTLRIISPDQTGAPQVAIILDSLPAMLPGRMDDDEEGNGQGVGLQARMFSDQLKRIKGKFRKKRVILLAVNQLREKPMAMGDPTYEPCGGAVRFYSDCRLRFTDRALSAVAGAKGKGRIEEEDSVTNNGVDTYRYIHVRAIKNKLSVPYLEGFLRLWIKDGNGEARGFDPVFDTYEYLRATKQLEGNRNKIKLKLVSRNGEVRTNEKYLNWEGFKILILGNKEEMLDVYDKIKMKPVPLRPFCQKQMASGFGLELFNRTGAAVGTKQEGDEDNVGNDDEE